MHKRALPANHKIFICQIGFFCWPFHSFTAYSPAQATIGFFDPAAQGLKDLIYISYCALTLGLSGTLCRAAKPCLERT